MHRVVPIAAVAVLVSLLAAGSAHAQQGTGELRGRVVDAQNAVLPGVNVVARNEASGMFREIVSGPDGSFFMSALTPGSYEITAQLAGFKKYQRKGIRVEVGKTQSVDVQLEVGGIEQQVTVTAESPLIDTTTKQIGGTVTAQELNDIPSINRNSTTYLGTLPGVTAFISTDSFGADSIRINGQGTQNVNYTLDGAGNNDTFNGGNGGAQARTPVEAIQEFQLLTSQFDAEFGASSGGVVNAVAKSGPNQLHGTGFFFDATDKMTVRDYFAEKQNLSKPETRQLQWGGNLGGPAGRHLQRCGHQPRRVHGGKRRPRPWRARPEPVPAEHAHGLSVQAARRKESAGPHRHLQRDEPRQFQPPDQHHWQRDECRPTRRGDVPDLPCGQRPDADGAVQSEVHGLTQGRG